LPVGDFAREHRNLPVGDHVERLAGVPGLDDDLALGIDALLDRAAIRVRSTWVQPSNKGTRASRFTMGSPSGRHVRMLPVDGRAASARESGRSGLDAVPFPAARLRAHGGRVQSCGPSGCQAAGSRHRLPAFLITSVSLVLLADAIRRVLSDADAQLDALTWAALALMVYASVRRPVPAGRAPEQRSTGRRVVHRSVSRPVRHDGRPWWDRRSS
jgi:hypothetical protein